MPAARAFCVSLVISPSTSFAVREHEVREFVDDADDEGPDLERFLNGILGRLQRIGNRLAVFRGPADLLVVVVEVTHTHAAHHGIAAVHLAGEPLEGRGRLVHVGDDGAEKMRNAVVERELEHLRVDQHEPEVRGRIAVKHRENHGIDANRLARPRRTSHEQMRHLGEVDHEGLAADVLAERERERRRAFRKALLSRISLRRTVSRTGFGTSRPMKLVFGMLGTTRTA